MVHYSSVFVLSPALIFLLFISANANANANAEHATGVKLPLVYGARRVLSGMVTEFGMDVVGDGFGEYYVKLGVGSLAIEQTLKMDTGSDLTWIQSQECEPTCFPQRHQRYDPTKSSSIKWVPCHSDTCKYLIDKKKKDGCNEDQCGYRLEYRDGAYTSGSVANETLTIFNGTLTIPSVMLGFSNDNHISFNGHADGLLGLGRGPLSLTNQPDFQRLAGGAFRFCLTQQNGWLTFGGRSNFPDGNRTKWASLILNNKHPSLYYVELLGIEVEGKALDIPEKTFQIDPKTEDGGVTIDTGTSVTRLSKVAYNALRDTLKPRYLDKLFAPIAYSVDPILDTCYFLGSGVDLERASLLLPRVSFIFRGLLYVQTIHVDATNILRGVESPNNNVACLAFAPSTAGHTILAGEQLEDIQITIDAVGGFISFGPHGC